MLDMAVTLVDAEAQLPRLEEALRGCTRVALDVEWRPDSLLQGGGASGSSPAALLQISVAAGGGAAEVFLVDLLALHVRTVCCTVKCSIRKACSSRS